MLNTLAVNREVISRGELVEIGELFLGMISANCVLREIGTTNHAASQDYQSAINSSTSVVMRVHTKL